MVITGVKRRMEELLEKHMNDLRYAYAFMVTGHPLLGGTLPFITPMHYIFFLLIFWGRNQSEIFLVYFSIFGISFGHISCYGVLFDNSSVEYMVCDFMWTRG